MKKISFILALILAAVLPLGGHSPKAAQAANTVFSESSTLDAAVNDKTNISPLSVLLPTGMENFGKGLAQLAEKEGIALDISYLPKGSSYMTMLFERLAAENAPDIYFFEDSMDSKNLVQQGYLTEISRKNEADMLAITLAGMIPEQAQLADIKGKYAYPLGYNIEGVLVNIQLLAALLNTEDIEKLKRDLYECSYEEWEALVNVVHAYLRQPYKFIVKLNSNEYVLPRYRAEGAKTLRAVYSFASEDNSAYANIYLSKMLASTFEKAEDIVGLSAEEKKKHLESVLPGYFLALQLETAAMEWPGQNKARGENFSKEDEVSQQQALEAFAAGRTLFMRTDTNQLRSLISQNADLEEKTILVPVKMAYNSEKKEQNNLLVGFWCEGYLGVNGACTQKGSAFKLLQSLYLYPEGTELISEKLNLIPFNIFNTDNSIEKNLLELINLGKALRIPAEKYALEKTQAELGAYIKENMMLIENWDEDVYEHFSNAAYIAFGAKLAGQQDNSEDTTN